VIAYVKIVINLLGCPLWLAKYPDNPGYAPWLGPGSNSMPTDMDEFNKFIWNLATRYNGVINFFEIWNEPQLNDFFYPYNTAELDDLATMTQRAFNTIHSINPSAMVISSPMLPRASSGGMAKAQKYIDAIKAKGWNVDAFATHIYPNNGEGVAEWRSMAEDCQATLKASGAPNTKLWVTETYYNLLGPIIPEDSAQAYIDGTYQACSEIGIAQLYWYGWDQGANLGGLQISAESAAWAAIRAQAGLGPARSAGNRTAE
jgi:hypothetical protein